MLRTPAAGPYVPENTGEFGNRGRPPLFENIMSGEAPGFGIHVKAGYPPLVLGRPKVSRASHLLSIPRTSWEPPLRMLQRAAPEPPEVFRALI